MSESNIRKEPDPDGIEYHPFGYDWAGRFDEIQKLRGWEGGAAYAAQGEGSFWIITDEGTLADFLPEGDSLLMQLIRLERYDKNTAWELAKDRAKGGGAENLGN